MLLLDIFDPQPLNTTAFLNAHFATYFAGLAVFALVVWLGSAREEEYLSMHSWRFLRAFSGIAFTLIALFAVALQIDVYWRSQLPQEARFGGMHMPVYVEFSYSAWSMIYGAALMAAGFWRRSAFLRWQALVVLALSIAKVFLFDISHLSQGYRVISFLGLGVLLLAISFAYQRDWLGLRGAVK